MKLPQRRPAHEDPAATQPTTPRWPARYGEPAGQHQHAAGHSSPQQSQSPGYYAQQDQAPPPFAPQGHAPDYAQQPQAQHGRLPFGRTPPGGDPGHDYAQPQGGQPLPFGRYPQPGPEPQANYGYAQHGQEPSFGAYPDAPPQHQGAGAPAWSQQGDPRGTFDLGGYPQADEQHHDPSPFGGQHQHGYAETEPEYEETFGEEEEVPARRRRGLLIVGALVGAVSLGGGAAYTYKAFLAPRSGPAVVIKDTQGPVKLKPEVADGKGFAHTDKKLLSRLGEDASRPPATADAPPSADDRQGDDPNAPRKVRIIPITPGGPSASPPPAPVVTASAPPPSVPGMVMVPGVTLENTGLPRPPPQQARMPMPPPQAARVEAPAPPPPAARVPQPPVRPIAAAPPAPPAAAPVAEPPKARVPKTKPPAAPAAAAAPSPSTGAGFVAVLSSKKSRMDALKAFADMQQKYGDVLASRTPDVQEANLGDKGVWYRAVVGPPGSREAAANLCTQLKSAGHDGCWVTAY